MSNLTSYSVIVVDDEPPVRGLLRDLLRLLPGPEVVGEAGNVQEAVRLIHRVKPQVVFLDIEMPGYTGLQLLDFFNEEEIDFEIIFVTAYDEYAIQAFKLAAFDYLLKPVDEDLLAATLERYQAKQQAPATNDRIQLLKGAYSNPVTVEKIAISATYGVEFLVVEEIAYLEAQSNYTRVVKKDGHDVVASKPLSQFESLLMPRGNFFRAHRSFLINLHEVKKLNLKDGVTIELESGTDVPLSRLKRKEFEAWYQTMKI